MIKTRARFRVRQIEIRATLVEEPDIVRTPEGDFPVDAGDWLVREEESDKLILMADDEFRSIYEPVPGDELAEGMWKTRFRLVKEIDNGTGDETEKEAVNEG